MTVNFITIQRDMAGPRPEGQPAQPVLSRLGAQVVIDFVQHAILMGLGFQLRAGTVTTPLVGDVVLTDQAAEFCVDAGAGYRVIPIGLGIGVRLGTGTLHEYAAKSVGAVSASGTAFVPLPLRTLTPAGAAGTASNLVARVAAAGGVAVTAELATTTLRHWEYSNPLAAAAGSDPGFVAIAAGQAFLDQPVLVGPRCLYVQIAATGTGPSYYAHMDWLEFPTASLL